MGIVSGACSSFREECQPRAAERLRLRCGEPSISEYHPGGGVSRWRSCDKLRVPMGRGSRRGSTVARRGKPTAAGSAHVTDTFNHTIRKITPAGAGRHPPGVCGSQRECDVEGDRGRLTFGRMCNRQPGASTSRGTYDPDDHPGRELVSPRWRVLQGVKAGVRTGCGECSRVLRAARALQLTAAGTSYGAIGETIHPEDHRRASHLTLRTAGSGHGGGGEGGGDMGEGGEGGGVDGGARGPFSVRQGVAIRQRWDRSTSRFEQQTIRISRRGGWAVRRGWGLCICFGEC